MKTYFNYEGQINSKEVAEAIAFPIGIGPFMGFGSATIDNQVIKLYRGADSSSPYAKSINDRLPARNIALSGDTTIPTFGLINRTGHIWVSTQDSIEANIRGSQGSWNEALVFAVFQNIESPVLNKPSIVAYWNSSNISFYEYWKKSINPNYAASTLIETDPWESEISFVDLIEKVEGAVNTFKNSKTMVLIGIYGTGVDAETNNNESFAIVPYSGEFPQSVPFSLDYYTTLRDSLKDLKSFVKTGLEKYPNLKSYLEGLTPEESSAAEVGGIVPIGGIIIFSGTIIPDNWVICDGNNGTPNLSGKFIMGSGGDYRPGNEGGNKEVTLTENNMPAHKHKFKDYYFPEKTGNLSGNYDRLSINGNKGSKGNDTDNDAILYYEHDTYSAGQERPTAISLLPPYYVLAYIMRIK